MDKLAQIKALIGTDAKVAEEITKYCRQIKANCKILNMKSYVLERLDKKYDMNIIEEYLDKITDLKHKVRDNTKVVIHDITVNSSFKINDVLVELQCRLNEDTENYFTIEIHGGIIVNDEMWGNNYCMVKKDSNITNFNLEHFNKLDILSQTCAQNGSVNEDSKTKNYYDEPFDEKNYFDYDENDEEERGIIDLKLFVEVCKNNFPDVNPIEMFDMIMLCLIYCYKV